MVWAVSQALPRSLTRGAGDNCHLGASAENSGCFSQPGKRCMANRGVEPVNMVWGEPRRRPFKGFAVRFFEWLNVAKPEHQLFNAGRDASSRNVAPCLFSHLPPSFDLILIEAGSMFETGSCSKSLPGSCSRCASRWSSPDGASLYVWAIAEGRQLRA